MKLRKKTWMYRAGVQIEILAVILGSVIESNALTITSGPTVTRNTNAPLTAGLELTTDDYSRVRLTVSDALGTWSRDFYDYNTVHSVPVFGLRPNQTNLITVTVFNRFGDQAAMPQPAVVITTKLPSDFPILTLVTNVPEKMEPGYTLFRLINQNTRRGYLVIVDGNGKPAWYSSVTSVSEVKQLESGDLMFNPAATSFVEMSLLGQIIHAWQTPTNLPIDVHEILPTDRGTILYLSDTTRVVTNFPSSATDPSAPTRTATVACQSVVEISATNSAVLNVWSPIDMIDPRRIDYLTYTSVDGTGTDWEHANAIIEDRIDDSLIVSLRNQDALIKFSRATGQLKWILGSHVNWGWEFQKYLFNPVGTPFEWNYGQHGPTFTPEGTLLVYDDGNYRASPFDPQVINSNNYSRAVEYKLDEKNMQISQVWDYGRTNDDRLYTDRVGNTRWLPARSNVLMTFGYVLYENGAPVSRYSSAAAMLRIKEVTHETSPQVVFDLACFDYSNTNRTYLGTAGYRSYRIPDLYPVVNAAQEVADLIPEVSSSGARRCQTLVASLGSALESIAESNTHVAIQRLNTFQLLTRLAQLTPDAADQLIYPAQGIIDGLGSGNGSYASERLTGEFPVFSAYHALADLMCEVGSSGLRNQTLLLTTLKAALSCIGDNDPEAIHDLRAFQALVDGIAAKSRLTNQFRFQAQRIIDFINRG